MGNFLGNLLSSKEPPPAMVLVPPIFDFPPLPARTRMLVPAYDLLFGKLVLRCLFDDYFEDALQMPPIMIFIGRIGERTANILKYLFPVPKPDSKRIVTFANRSDYISFRMQLLNSFFQYFFLCLKMSFLMLDSISSASLIK